MSTCTKSTTWSLTANRLSTVQIQSPLLCFIHILVGNLHLENYHLLWWYFIGLLLSLLLLSKILSSNKLLSKIRYFFSEMEWIMNMNLISCFHKVKILLLTCRMNKLKRLSFFLPYCACLKLSLNDLKLWILSCKLIAKLNDA